MPPRVLKYKRKIARVFEPLEAPKRYKGAHGGRGSGKSHYFAEALVMRAVDEKGFLGLAGREVQRTLTDSSKRLVENKIREFNLEAAGFKIFDATIETPGDGAILFRGLSTYSTGSGTASGLKSLEGVKIAWLDEAQDISDASLTLLRPTIRVEGSEIWASWNPRRKSDAVDVYFRQHTPPNGICVEANYRDNPWFPAELEADRLHDLNTFPDRYQHIWDGGYATSVEGAYYAKQLHQAQLERRICRLSRDPILPIWAYWDIGGTGAKADAMSIWIVQKVSRDIRFLDYFEGQGQPLGYYLDWFRRCDYSPQMVLPHDGDAGGDFTTGKTLRNHLQDAGYRVTVVKNQGRGAAKMRIEAARRLFPAMWFDEDKTEAGREALGFYHEKKDEARNVGLGPEHDWSSHAADAFGLAAVHYELPASPDDEPGKHRPSEGGRGGWLGA